MTINNNFNQNSFVNLRESGQTRKGVSVDGTTSDAALDRAIEDNDKLRHLNIDHSAYDRKLTALREGLTDAGYGQNVEYGTNDDNTILDMESATITSFGGNDTITTGNFGDIIISGAGNDVIDSGNNNDKVDGGDGQDTIEAGYGDDHVFGGNGNDTIEGGAGFDVLYGEDGNDIISGGAHADYLNGGAGNDVLDGGTGDDFLVAGTGNDIVRGGEGNDTLIIEADPDNFIFEYDEENNIRITDINDPTNITTVSDVENFIFLTEEFEEVFTLEEIEALIELESGGEEIIGTDGHDHLVGSDANDTIYTNGGNDTVDAGAGNDSIYLGAGNKTVNAGNGTDTVELMGNIEDYTAIDNGNGSFVLAGANGTKVINNAEIFRFNNGTEVSTMTANQLLEYINGEISLAPPPQEPEEPPVEPELPEDPELPLINDAPGAMNFSTNIQGGNGDNNIRSYASEANINVGDGENLILAYSDNANITTGNGNNRISLTYNQDFNMSNLGEHEVRAGNGDDHISMIVDQNIVNTGDGDNYVYATSDFNQITSGNGSDEIEVLGNQNEVSTGGGDDLVHLDMNKTSRGNSDVYEDYNHIINEDYHYLENNPRVPNLTGNNIVNTGEGNDRVIITDQQNNTIITGEGNDTVDVNTEVRDGSIVTWDNGGSSTVGGSLLGAFSNNIIDTGEGDDTVNLSLYGSTVDTGADNDVVNLFQGDSLYNASGAISRMTETNIATGSGDDIININDMNQKLNGINFNDPESDDDYHRNLILNLRDEDHVINTMGRNSASGVYSQVATNLNAGEGDDTIRIGTANLRSQIHVNGGEGNDTLVLEGSLNDYEVEVLEDGIVMYRSKETRAEIYQDTNTVENVIFEENMDFDNNPEIPNRDLNVTENNETNGSTDINADINTLNNINNQISEFMSMDTDLARASEADLQIDRAILMDEILQSNSLDDIDRPNLITQKVASEGFLSFNESLLADLENQMTEFLTLDTDLGRASAADTRIQISITESLIDFHSSNINFYETLLNS